jgi:hypothetical protein
MLAEPATERARKSYLPLLDQITDRVGHNRIDAVLIEQIDIVGAKLAQEAFHRLTDMLSVGADPRRSATVSQSEVRNISTLGATQ